VRAITFAFAVLICFAAPVCAQITIAPAHASGVYNVGEKVDWTITERDPADTTQYSFTMLRNGVMPMSSGPLQFLDGKATLDARLDAPGSLFLEIRPAGAARGRARRIIDGALIDPDQIRGTLPRPDDFDAWWSAKIDRLHAIPANPNLEPTDPGKSDVEYDKITLDTVDSHHIRGQLACPTKEGKYPALLILQWAGVYKLQKSAVVERARQGWLALNIEPHDIEIDGDAVYYQGLANGELKDYFHQGNSDREKSYFLRMYLSAYRAAEYLTSRPDWDGKTLVVTGTSMGGQQSLVLAGLYNKVTGVVVLVPSSCDAAGPTNRDPRAAGFPDWAAQSKQKADPSIIETSRYFDPENFAGHIKCPTLVSMGLYDETSPPAGVYSAFNQIKGPKEALPLHSGHQDQAGSQRPYNARAEQWLAAFRTGATLPPP
jgi:cephalosporin-C deacetylase